MTQSALTLAFLTILFFSTGQITYAQHKSITYSNSANAYYSEQANKKDIFFASKINEIILNPNSTFEFWSRPHSSCLTWHEYKGNWKRDKDSLLFFDSYQLEENDTKANFKRDSIQEFVITFKTDKNSILKNRRMKIQYEYDYYAHINRPEEIFYLNANNSVIIPYKDIPNLDKLAAIRVEYLLNYTEKRCSYLTENKTINVKQGDIPNIINVEFIERPQKEIVYRTIRAVVKNDTLTIVSSSKTKTILPDYHADIGFEDSYSLNK